MSKLLYPIYKLPEEFMQDYEKRELTRYMKWWLYKRSLQTLSSILTGSNFTLTNSAKRYFKKFKVMGKTEQASLTGINLLPTAEERTQTNNGITFTSYGNGKYQVTGTATAETYLYFNLKENVTFPEETLYCHIRNTEISNMVLIIGNDTRQASPSLSAKNRIMTSQNFSSLNVTYVAIKVPLGVTVNLLLEPSIELSNEITEYEPYCGGIPAPNPNFECPIKNVRGNIVNTVSNKNLLEVTKVYEETTMNGVTFKTNADGTITLNGTATNAIDVRFNESVFETKLEANQNYILSKKIINGTANQLMVAYYLGGTQTFTTNIKDLGTSENTRILRNCRIFVNSGDVFNNVTVGLMVLKGSTDSDYVTHEKQNLVFTLEEGQFLGAGDSLEDNGIHNTWEEILLNGTENFELVPNKNNTFRLRLTKISQKRIMHALFHKYCCGNWSKNWNIFNK